MGAGETMNGGGFEETIRWKSGVSSEYMSLDFKGKVQARETSSSRPKDR